MGIITIFFSLFFIYFWFCFMYDFFAIQTKIKYDNKTFNESMGNRTRDNYDNPSLGYIDSAMFLSMYDE